MDDALPILRSALACGILLGTLWLVAAAIRRLRDCGSATSLLGRVRTFGVGRRLTRTNAPRRAETGLRIVDRLALGPGSGIALVRCEGRSLVLGLGSGVPVVLAAFASDATFEADGPRVEDAETVEGWHQPRTIRRGRAPRRSSTDPRSRAVTSRSCSRALDSLPSSEPDP